MERGGGAGGGPMNRKQQMMAEEYADHVQPIQRIKNNASQAQNENIFDLVKQRGDS